MLPQHQCVVQLEKLNRRHPPSLMCEAPGNDPISLGSSCRGAFQRKEGESPTSGIAIASQPFWPGPSERAGERRGETSGDGAPPSGACVMEGKGDGDCVDR